MKLADLRVTAVVGLILTFAPSVFAVEASPRTLQQCATLLPAGKTYSFHMSGTIDRTQQEPVLSGTLSMEDGTNVDRGNEGEAFGKCVAALIK